MRAVVAGVAGKGQFVVFYVNGPITASNNHEPGEKNWDIRLYVAIDDDDTFFKKHLGAPGGWAGLPTTLTVVPKRYNRVPFNENAAAAHADNAEYYVRINDDTEFITMGWLTLGAAALSAMGNIGVVGPLCRQGNTAILTHDMTHRTHIDMFKGKYYASEFSGWWIDDWITKIYEPDRKQMLQKWEVTHHVSVHGTRYAVQSHEERLLKRAIKRGAATVTERIANQFNVVSYSLYGSDPRYTVGALENAQLAKTVYPGWSVTSLP